MEAFIFYQAGAIVLMRKPFTGVGKANRMIFLFRLHLRDEFCF